MPCLTPMKISHIYQNSPPSTINRHAQPPRKIQCHAADPKSSVDIPTNTQWDPEGILPPPSSGGHFARRSPHLVATEPPQQQTPGVVPQAPSSANDLLAPRKHPSHSSIIDQITDSATSNAASSPPISTRKFAEVPTAPEDQGIGAKVESTFLETFSGLTRADRVLESFRRLRSGEEFVQLWPGLGVQKAGSYVAGLTAVPFPDLYSGSYEWLEEVQKKASIIREEFNQVALQDGDGLVAKGNRIWVPAARKEAVSYGPNWRTLVLQDRGVWDEVNSDIFAKTKKILVDVDAPTLEVFFARQDGKTGIASHTDNANFIQTSHLGIDVPEGECHIKVGDHVREWRNGKIIVCDTSFMHETENNSERDRYVLIMRHWHPEMSKIERVATQFLFRSLDDPTSSGIKAAQKQAVRELKELSAGGKKKKAGGAGGGGGFGKKS